MPYTNRQAEFSCYNAESTAPILAGCAFVRVLGVTGASLNVKLPTGADAIFSGVADGDAIAGAAFRGYQLGFSNVQVRLASAVAFGDALHVADASGQFEKAGAGSQNVAYRAEQAGITGAVIWASPIGTRPL